MSPALSIDEAVYPPFQGFPRSGLEFLRKLKKNNNRQWFAGHKQRYEEDVRFPMQCLIASLAQQLVDDIPDMEFNPKKSIFRIYRDVRFSKNKSPYKTNIAASFDMRGSRSPTETPGLYLGIEPGEIFIGGGLYMPTGEQLKSIRKSIAEDPEQFFSVVGTSGFRKRFGALQGEKLQKAPLGYPRDHPMIEYLRYRQFYAGVELEEARCFNSRFLRTVASVFIDTMPLVRWLANAVR